jgi:hypothetical protein
VPAPEVVPIIEPPPSSFLVFCLLSLKRFHISRVWIHNHSALCHSTILNLCTWIYYSFYSLVIPKESPPWANLSSRSWLRKRWESDVKVALRLRGRAVDWTNSWSCSVADFIIRGVIVSGSVMTGVVSKPFISSYYFMCKLWTVHVRYTNVSNKMASILLLNLLNCWQMFWRIKWCL